MATRTHEPSIVVHGDVPDRMVAYARKKLLAVVDHAPGSALDAELRLEHHADPARERPDVAEMTVDLDGRIIRAHRHAPTMSEAIDRATARLRRIIEAVGERPRTQYFRHRDDESWHHGDRPTPQRHLYPRPREDRVLVRRKTFAGVPMAIEDALFDLDVLDHEFFLFVHDESGTEAVVYHEGAGYGIMQRVPTPEAIKRVEIPLDLGPHPAPMTLDDALETLDASEEPFMFFLNAEGNRGEVVYRRYDGHYGLVVASE